MSGPSPGAECPTCVEVHHLAELITEGRRTVVPNDQVPGLVAARDRGQILLASIHASTDAGFGAMHGHSANAVRLLGMAQDDLGEYAEADHSYEEAGHAFDALGVASAASELDYLRGYLAWRHDDDGLAEQFFDSVVRRPAGHVGTGIRARAQLTLGDILLGNDDSAGARRQFTDARAGFATSGEREMMRRATFRLAFVASRGGDKIMAESLYRDVLADAETDPINTGETASAGHLLGLLLIFSHRNAEAVEVLRHAEQRFEALGRQSESRTARLRLAQALELEHPNEAHSLYTELRNVVDGIEATEVLFGLGQIAYARGDWPQARLLFNQGLEISRTEGWEAEICRALVFLGEDAFVRGDRPTAEQLLGEGLARSKAAGEMTWVARTLKAQGDMAHAHGDEAGALGALNDALAMFTDLQDRSGIAEACRSLGYISTVAGRFDDALPNIERAERIYREIHHPFGVADCKFLGGEIARVRGDFDQAVRQYNEALDIGSPLPNHFAIANALRGLAEVDLARDHPKEAAERTWGALDIYTEAEHPHGVAECLQLLARIATRLGQSRDAVRLLEEVLARYAEIEDARGEARCHDAIAQIASQTGSPDVAADRSRQALERLDAVRGSLRSTFSRLAHGERYEDVYVHAIRHALDAGRTDEALGHAAGFLGRLVFEEQATTPEPISDLVLTLPLERREAWARVDAERLRARGAYDGLLAVSRDRAQAQVAAQGRGDPEGQARRAVADDPLTAAHLAAETAWWAAYGGLLTELAQTRPGPPPPVTTGELERAVAARGVALVLLIWRPGLECALVLVPGRAPVAFRYDADTVNRIEAALADWTTWSRRRPGLLDTRGTGAPSRAEVREGDFDAALASLRDDLWAPLVPLVGDYPVRVCPDGSLAAVPFGHLDRSRRLAGLRVLPGPALLVAGAPATRSADARDPSRTMLAIGADPSGTLPGVEASLRLAATVPGARVVRPADDPVAVLLGEHGYWDVLTIAGHVDPADLPGRASVRLAVPDPDRPGVWIRRDLAALELTRLGIRARVVLLLGCAATGSGDGGADLLSVGAAVLTGTGAEAVLVACAPTSDLAGTVLWCLLRDPLAAGGDPDHVLAEALDRLADPAAARDALVALGDHPDLAGAPLGRYPTAAVWVGRDLLDMGAADGRANPLSAADTASWLLFGR